MIPPIREATSKALPWESKDANAKTKNANARTKRNKAFAGWRKTSYSPPKKAFGGRERTS